MSERPTPETDALIYKTRAGISMFDHARKMERARDELREKYDTLATEHMLEVNKLCNERDQARKKIKTLAWISVAQALPDDDATVIIHLADGGVEAGFLDAGAWRFVSGDRTDTPVLHWRPFPDAPKPSK